MANYTGYLQLSTEKKRGKTIAQDMYFYGAFKLMSPFYLNNDEQACFYIMNPGGGYVDGDTYRMDIHLDKEAQLLLTTQSASKIYKTPKNPVVQEINITLKEGSLLEYLPDPIIGYKNSRYKQKTIVHMEKGTSLIATDIITSGWDPKGNLFSYQMLDLNTKVYLDDNLILLDHIRLTPDIQTLSSIGHFEEYSHLGTMIVVSEYTDESLISMLYDLLETQNLKCRFGLSMLSKPGFMLRILASSTQEVTRAFDVCHKLIRMKWFKRSPVFLGKY